MAGLGLDFFGNLLSGGDIGSGLIKDISGGDPTKIFGKKPEVAEYEPVDLAAETEKAIAGNLKNLPNITELLNSITGGNFEELVRQGTTNALSLTKGELPDSTKGALQRMYAQQNVQGGYAGTPLAMGANLDRYAGDVLQRQQLGANMAQQWTGLAESAYSPFTVSTGQQAGTTAANNAGIQAMKQFQFNVAAAPTPASLGHFLLDKSIGDQFMSFGLGAAGGAIAGGGSSIGGAPQGQGQGQYAQQYQPYDWRQSAIGYSPNFNVTPTWNPPPITQYGYTGGGG